MGEAWGIGVVGVPARPARDGTRSSRLTAILDAGADPFRVVLAAELADGEPDRRWAIIAGRLDHPGDEGRGEVLAGALAILAEPAARRERLVTRTGDPAADRLLAGTAPALAALLRDLTARQREVGRLLLIDGLRRSEIATRLRISRPTVSVMVDRARLLEIAQLAGAMASIFAEGLARAASQRAASQRAASQRAASQS